MKLPRIVPLIGLVTLVVTAGCSAHLDSPTNTGRASATNSLSATFPTSQSVEPNYPIVIYNNEDYVIQSQTLHNVQSYVNGNVSSDDMKPRTQPSIHGPWHMDPVQVAQICTANLQPPEDKNQTGRGKLIPNQLVSYEAKGQLITFRLTKHTPATKDTPETAVVETSGLAHNLRVYLFLPKATFTWIIYRIEMLG